MRGQLRKMLTEYTNPIRYYLNFDEGFVEMNQLLGRKIELTHVANQCMNCGLNKPIFRMGYCKSCFFTVPQTNESIIRPELSKAHLGIEERDLVWEQKLQLQPHVVYLALSGGLKVGVTRETQIPTRWIDQGLSEAIVLAKTENRYEAGTIEVELKNHLADKTNYQQMLKNINPEVDLIDTKHQMGSILNDEQSVFYSGDDEIWSIHYPVLEYPKKVKSLNLTKTPTISGELAGIKGQYLIFLDGSVINIRNHEGFVVELNFN